MNKLIPFTLSLLFTTDVALACTEPVAEVMHSQTINEKLTLTKLGHYCKAGSRFATATLEEAQSLDWAEYSFELTIKNSNLDMSALVGSERRLKKFANIHAVSMPATEADIVGLQFVAKSSANIYSEIHLAKLINNQLVPIASIIEPLTQYQALQRSGSEYQAMGFYQLKEQHWLIDSLIPAEETGDCNACQQYQVISWSWQQNELSEHSRRDYDIDTYTPLSE